MEQKRINKADKKRREIFRRKNTDVLSCGSCGDTGSFASDLGQELPCCCIHGYRLRANINLKKR